MKTDLFTIQSLAEEIDARLRAILSCDDEDVSLVYRAMSYSTLAGGKRIRPYLTSLVSEMLGGDRQVAIEYGCALEMVHTYSLIHDDLPCMDDDDYRRGKPSCHRAFGEATAVLAGDGLLTHAFGVLAAAPCSAEQTVQAVKLLSEAAGCLGMIGGQIMDMQAERTEISIDTLRKLEGKKTGSLIRAAVRLGAISANCTDTALMESLDIYARNIGLTYQIIDDVLDVYGDGELGKTLGSDREQGKTTFLTFYTKEEAEAQAERLTEEACAALPKIEGAVALRDFAYQLLHRHT